MSNFSFSTDQLKAAWQTSLKDILAQEAVLSQATLQEVEAFATQLFPLIAQQTQEMLSSPNPETQMQYIDGLLGAQVDMLAQVAGEQIIAQRSLIIEQAKKFILDLADGLLQLAQNPVLSVLLKAVVAVA